MNSFHHVANLRHHNNRSLCSITDIQRSRDIVVSMGVHNSFVGHSYQTPIIQLQQDAKKCYIYFMPAVYMLREYDNISCRGL